MYGKSALTSSRVVGINALKYYSQNITKKLLGVLAEMPKAQSSRITETQRQRKLIAKKSEQYAPSTVYLQVLGSGARGAPNTLYLFSDQKKYLFNCGESTQRLAHEHKVKLSRLNHIFITRKTWRNIGGLPGLSLTLQDVGVPNLTLHGPDGLDELYNATKRFVIMKDMNVNMAKCITCDDFEDNVMTVKYLTLTPMDDIFDKETKPSKKQRLDSQNDKVYEEFSCDDTDYYRQEVRQAHSPGQVDKKDKPKVKPREVDKADSIKKKTEKVLHDLQKLKHCTIAFICTLKKRLGTLDLAKCVERGVKPGPMLGELKSGLDVVLSDGTLVLSKDVKTPDDPGPVFIVLEVPEITYLKEVDFAPYFSNEVNPPENVPVLVVHYTPPHVIHHPKYRAFMSMFGPFTQHLILNGQNTCLGSEAVHRTQHKLHLLDPDIFPILKDMSIPIAWNQQIPTAKNTSPMRMKCLEELKNKFQNILNSEGTCKGDGEVTEEENEHQMDLITGRTLTTFHLRPKRQLDRSLEPKMHIQEYYQETMDTDGFVGSLEQFRRMVDNVRYMKRDAQQEYPKVVFLGTGSCIPSKMRNTSAIVLHINENSSMLLDCGEGTFAQLVRFYGPKRVNSFLRTLKAVYVSHLHADHHIGLIGVLQARRLAFEDTAASKSDYEPLYLMAPGQIVTWLSIYDQQFEKIRDDFTLIPNQSLVSSYKIEDEQQVMTAAMLARLGLDQIATCYVSHCPNAFGVAVNIDNKHKITYSGDTIPCDELVKLGHNSTLLIHEATMEDELADEARVKMHSTTSQAIEVGRQMNAKYTVLTHFSQRYARLPRLNASMLNDNKSVGIAFDNMQITMSDLEFLPHMYAPLQLMFAEHCVEMELKAANRNRVKERRSPSPHVGGKRINVPQNVRNKRSTKQQMLNSSTASSRPPANYRESLASKLRQESKGMPVCGIVGRTKTSLSPSAKTSKSNVSKSVTSPHTSGSTTPSVNERGMLPSAPTDSRMTFDITRPSYTSLASIDSKQTMRSKTPPKVPAVVNSRKTLNSIRPSSGENRIDSFNSAKKRAYQCNYYTSANSTPTYTAKPSATETNTRILANKPRSELDSSTKKTAVTPTNHSRIPPTSWKSGNYNGVSPTLFPNNNANTSLLSTKRAVSGNKLKPFTSNVKDDLKMFYPPAPATPDKLSKPVSQRSLPTRFIQRTPNVRSASISRERTASPSPNKNMRSGSAPLKRPNKPVTPLNSQALPKSALQQRVSNKIEVKKDSFLNESRTKDQLSNESTKKQTKWIDHKQLTLSKPFPSSRTFKPQLEDIKSSLFLLKHDETNDKPVKRNEISKNNSSIPNPKVFNEQQRKEQLMKIRNKYKSREFFSDSSRFCARL